MSKLRWLFQRRYTVLRTEPLTNPQAKDLSWLEQNADFDFWRPGGGGRSADIMASPSQLPYLKEFLESLGIKYEVMIEDVGRSVRLKMMDCTRLWENKFICRIRSEI